MKTRIHSYGDHPAIRRAGMEMARCLEVMTGEAPLLASASTGGNATGLVLGPAAPPRQPHAPPPVNDPHWDDAWIIRSQDDTLCIAGTNPRSVLMGTYDYLRRLGAEWVHPGPSGERLPPLASVPLAGFDETLRPRDRHRGLCIEGAPSIEHVLELVDWMPKVGYNSYFLQFQTAAYFWRLWYGHELNAAWPDRRVLTDDECAALDRRVTDACLERGLLLHQVGHGWTAMALDLPASGWVSRDGDLPEEKRLLLAEVNGRRALWGGIPINTELCYGNPKARAALIDSVLAYARAHPGVDALHFWLSDAPNNHCECKACRALGPWDWYATLLNELSPRLKRIAPRQKIVLLAYHDLLWPPERVPLDRSHGNLVAMFAPITRCYGHRILDPDCSDGHKPVRPERNHMEMPRNNHALAALWRKWQWNDPAHAFAFDYHFMWPWMGDRLTVKLEKLLPQDIDDYRKLGLEGMMHCGSQRVFYPDGWPLYQAARLLCGEPAGTAERERYDRLAYGKEAPVARRFLDGLSRASGPAVHATRQWQQIRAESLDAMEEHLQASRERLATARADLRGSAQERGWMLLMHLHEWVERMAALQRHLLAGRLQSARKGIAEARHFLRATEKETHPALDTFVLLKTLDRMENNLKASQPGDGDPITPPPD